MFIDCSDYQESPKAKDNAELEFPTIKRCAKSCVHFSLAKWYMVHGNSSCPCPNGPTRDIWIIHSLLGFRTSPRKSSRLIQYRYENVTKMISKIQYVALTYFKCFPEKECSFCKNNNNKKLFWTDSCFIYPIMLILRRDQPVKQFPVFL